LTNCPACQRDIPEGDETCPHCGVVVSKWRDRNYSRAPAAAQRREPIQIYTGPSLLGIMIWSSLAILIAAGGVIGYQRMKAAAGQRVPAALTYTDVDGEARTFKHEGTAPTVVAFWISNCGYSQNAMWALNEVRRQYRGDEVDVIGFYMNPSVDADVKSIAKRERYEVTLATVQNMSLGPNGLLGQLNDAFHVRGAGRDVYVVDKEGRIRTIPAVDEKGKLRPRPDIVSDLHSALGTVLPPG
jgi:AhpC/TSA family